MPAAISSESSVPAEHDSIERERAGYFSVSHEGSTVDLGSALSNTRACLDSIEKTLALYHGKPGKIVYGHWVVRHRSQIHRLIEHMHRVEQTILSLLVTISTYNEPFHTLVFRYRKDVISDQYFQIGDIGIIRSIKKYRFTTGSSP